MMQTTSHPCGASRSRGSAGPENQRALLADALARLGEAERLLSRAGPTGEQIAEKVADLAGWTDVELTALEAPEPSGSEGRNRPA